MNLIKKKTVDLLLDYMSKDPIKHLPKMIDLAETLDRKNMHAAQIAMFRKTIINPDSIWSTFVQKLFDEVDIRCIKKLSECFFINGTLDNTEREVIKEKYDINIPWTILMDPTSACNLECIGCWAAQYGAKNNLSFETLDRIITEGKALDIRFYIYSGGEPLVRKADLIKLAEKHQDCYFFAFTNGTLVDDDFCKDLLRVANFTLAFSIEGDGEATDMRRGEGVYQQVIDGMKLMRSYRLPFGYSTCYHSKNTYEVGGDAFIDEMIGLGCRFAWNFTYMPVGVDAVPDLLATSDQRKWMHDRMRVIRDTKPVFAMDFWNDGEYTEGCIAGGRRYFHINAAGDVEPCAFVHYSNLNINEVSLLEALQSPIFKAYKECQPFNDNHMRPCPVLDNPEAIEKMVSASGAHSTDMMAPEPVESLTAKTHDVAQKWGETSDPIWEKHVAEKESLQKKVSGK
ncbi:MAG: radical SAM protein [Clostridiales Family XIII bacterium]|jgi:MoaA/NifB/PqqE/SkfB family radical SAM enzyme|nr:radical SAM protein [Clostridiales Family XIII bacterium]